MTARCLQDFAGEWHFTRHILHDDGTHADVTGQVRFDPVPGGLAYVETGEMVLNGATLTTQRRYLWADGLRVYFEDGRFFHTVPALGGAAAHWCDPDQYDVAYDFGNWPDWHSSWTVKGPRKSYQMYSRYHR